MTDAGRRKGGGGKLTRSETVTVRLDPKLRYLAELGARKQRRTLSSYIEWAVEDSLNRIALETRATKEVTLADQAASLWDVDEADRFAKLALRYPDLLTHEEQVLWKLVRENGALWKRNPAVKGNAWTWTVDEGSLVFDQLRAHWAAFCSVAETGAGHQNLPKWSSEFPFVGSSVKARDAELGDTGTGERAAQPVQCEAPKQSATPRPSTPSADSRDSGNDVPS